MSICGGSTGPNSFDCSGFTQWVYRQNGIYIPRTSSEQKAAAKKVVSLSELEVGDILWRSGHVGNLYWKWTICSCTTYRRCC